MRKLVALCLLLFFGGTAIAQENIDKQVPVPVRETFSGLYPSVKAVSWKFDDTNYTASFKENDKTISLVIDEEGYVMEVKNEIKLYELPPDVNHFLGREYSGWTIYKTSHINSNGTSYYEAVVEREDESMVLVFNRNGDLMIKVTL
jgi:hypothetical protein